jgi:adenosine deaminase
MASVRRCVANLELIDCRRAIRIGHGVAFLTTGTGTTEFRTAMSSFRSFLADHAIVCELNPTSNHYLLNDSFTSASTRNERALPKFLAEKVPVVLCTDDDGIWAIQKCVAHHHHISVANEFCQAILNGEIKTETELADLISSARAAAFVGEALPN